MLMGHSGRIWNFRTWDLAEESRSSSLSPTHAHSPLPPQRPQPVFRSCLCSSQRCPLGNRCAEVSSRPPSGCVCPQEPTFCAARLPDRMVHSRASSAQTDGLDSFGVLAVTVDPSLPGDTTAPSLLHALGGDADSQFTALASASNTDICF